MVKFGFDTAHNILSTYINISQPRKHQLPCDIHSCSMAKDKILEKLRCEKCPYETFRRGSLSNYTRNVHDKVTDHICDECGKAFPTKSYLNKHESNVHLIIKDHFCK